MRYFLDPFGCVKNQVDAENMMAFLNDAGWSAADDAADADLVIVNSCGFIESAKQESINAVLDWRKRCPDTKILLAGCLAQRYAKELAESLPEADGFFGVEDIGKIAEAANALRGQGTGDSPLLSAPCPLLPSSLRPLLSLPGSAYVKISEGCDNNCSYCAIPLIRGPLRCRSMQDIVEECRGLLARGIKELCIIGQDIGAYRQPGSGPGESGLPELLCAIAEIQGQFWVRLLYMHPGHFPLPVLDLMEKDPRFLPYFDIPFQHASPSILAAMNRQGTAESYLNLVATIRSRLYRSRLQGSCLQGRHRFPAAIIRTTFLVGFPGETAEDFAALLDFQEKLRPDWLGCFSYSREEDTPAYTMKGQVSKKIAAQRKREIEERQIPITEKNMEQFIGQSLDVLLEEQFSGGAEESQDGDLWLGRLYCHAPEVDGAAVIVGMEHSAGTAGNFIPCKVIARRGIDLEVCPE